MRTLDSQRLRAKGREKQREYESLQFLKSKDVVAISTVLLQFRCSFQRLILIPGLYTSFQQAQQTIHIFYLLSRHIYKHTSVRYHLPDLSQGAWRIHITRDKCTRHKDKSSSYMGINAREKINTEFPGAPIWQVLGSGSDCHAKKPYGRLHLRLP